MTASLSPTCSIIAMLLYLIVGPGCYRIRADLHLVDPPTTSISVQSDNIMLDLNSH